MRVNKLTPFFGMQTKINGGLTIGNNHLLYKQGFQKICQVVSFFDESEVRRQQGWILNKLVDKEQNWADCINDLRSPAQLL